MGAIRYVEPQSMYTNGGGFIVLGDNGEELALVRVGAFVPPPGGGNESQLAIAGEHARRLAEAFALLEQIEHSADTKFVTLHEHPTNRKLLLEVERIRWIREPVARALGAGAFLGYPINDYSEAAYDVVETLDEIHHLVLAVHAARRATDKPLNTALKLAAEAGADGVFFDKGVDGIVFCRARKDDQPPV